MRALRCCVLLLGLTISATAALAARAKAPPWLQALARTPPTVPSDGAHAVVLLDEAVVDVAKDGTLTQRTRWAVRVQDAAGRSSARALLTYRSDSMKVRSFKAWLIRPDGSVRAYGKDRLVDAAVYSNALELYSEERRQIIAAGNEAEPGCVFGYEAVHTEDTMFLQRTWSFQAGQPVERSSLTVNLAPGWGVTGRVFNHEPVQPVVAGSSHTWTLARLPEPVDEPHAPPTETRVPWLAIDLHLPARDRKTQFTSWTDISTYFTRHYDEASVTDPALQARAETLVAGAASDWDRIRALCEFVQRVNYISISLNGGQGGGIIPRPASRVLQCNYGDCKDKTTLLRALLRSQGIVAYPLLVYAGSPAHVREEWPSPVQFNHAILGISVDERVDRPAVLTHPRLGRLLCFDPTDSFTPPGWLSEGTLGGRGLVLAGVDGGLVRLPAMQAEHNRIERRVVADLGPDGSIAATIEESFHGHASRDLRSEYRERSASQYETLIQEWLARSVPTPRLAEVKVTDAWEEARYDLDLAFVAPSYGKPMRNVLLVFKPVVVARRENAAFRGDERTQPVHFEPYAFDERTEFTLPEGYRVDEMIDPVELVAPFGRYTARATVEGNRLVFERSLQLQAAVVPPADYPTVRTFYEKMQQAEQSPVVLERL